jgi:hypothetical protein
MVGGWASDKYAKLCKNHITSNNKIPLGMGLLDGVHEQTVNAELCTNERGGELLNQISQDTGIFYDLSKDALVYPSALEDEEGHQIIYH